MKEEWEDCDWETIYNEDLGVCIKQEFDVDQYLYHEREVLVAMIEALDEVRKDNSKDSDDIEI